MYYSISKSKSKFYSTSKEPREGYEKVTYGADNNVTYHKYVPMLEGVLSKVVIEQKTIRGAEFSFLAVELVNNEGYRDSISCVLKEYGRFTEQTKAMVSALNGAEFGSRLSFSVKTKKTPDGEKAFLNIYANYLDKLDENNRPMSTGYIKATDIPRGEVVVDELGQKSTNYNEQNKFFTTVVRSLLKRSKEYESKAPSEPQRPVVKESFTKVADTSPSAGMSPNPLDEFLKSDLF